jgi:hypothetical protein
MPPSCPVLGECSFVGEPAKPAAAYLAAKGHAFTALGVFVMSELLKFLVVERLFAVTRDKLMSIPVFAWAYHRYGEIKCLSAWVPTPIGALSY